MGVFIGCCYAQDSSDTDSAVYIVTLKQAPTSHVYGSELRVKQGHHVKGNGTDRMSRLNYKPR